MGAPVGSGVGVVEAIFRVTTEVDAGVARISVIGSVVVTAARLELVVEEKLESVYPDVGMKRITVGPRVDLAWKVRVATCVVEEKPTAGVVRLVLQLKAAKPNSTTPGPDGQYAALPLYEPEVAQAMMRGVSKTPALVTGRNVRKELRNAVMGVMAVRVSLLVSNLTRTSPPTIGWLPV